MNKKRLLCVFLALFISFFTFFSMSTLAVEADEPKEVILSMYSNLSIESNISGLYRENVFYVTLNDICKLSGGKVDKETNEEAIISFGNGIREFVIDVGSGVMQETLFSANHIITMPSIIQNGKVYISALHFLRYIGATVELNESANIQFMVFKRYDIYDALADLIETDCGNFFWWDEVSTENENLSNKLVNAGIVTLINRDSNIIRMIFDTKGIEQDALEDALLSIVKNEGGEYFIENSPASELINLESGVIGAESEWFELIREALSDNSDLGKQISNLASASADAAEFTNKMVTAVEGMRQFYNLTETQKNLLNETIIGCPEASKTLCDGWENILAAAQNIDNKIQKEYGVQYETALEVMESIFYDILESGVGNENPVAIAWSEANLLTKMIPYTNEMISKKEQLYNSYNCSIIQLIANEMLVEEYSDWYYNNGFYTAKTEQTNKLERIKQLIILQLKSTLTTRECLIRSGYLEKNYAEEMAKLNRETAFLLNRVEGCKITGVNLFEADYSEDISWIENYTDCAVLFYDKLVSELGYADDYIETTCITSINDVGASSVCRAPTDANLGIVFRSFLDFDKNGILDLFVIALEEREGELFLVYRLYWLDAEGSVNDNITYLFPLDIDEKSNYYFFTNGDCFISIHEDDSSGEWIEDNVNGGRCYYNVVNENVWIHHNDIHVYDFSEANNETGSLGIALYVNKDFRNDNVCYTIDTPTEYYAIYSRGFKLDVCDDKCLLTEEEGCSYINTMLAELLPESLGQIKTVSWDKRWTTSFIPSKFPDNYSALRIEAFPTQGIERGKAVTNVIIHGEYSFERNS